MSWLDEVAAPQSADVMVNAAFAAARQWDRVVVIIGNDHRIRIGDQNAGYVLSAGEISASRIVDGHAQSESQCAESGHQRQQNQRQKPQQRSSAAARPTNEKWHHATSTGATKVPGRFGSGSIHT